MYYKQTDSIYLEKPEDSNGFREEYLQGIRKLVQDKLNEARIERDKYGQRILADREKARNELKEMLGWPLNREPGSILNVRQEILLENAEWIVSRVHFEVFPGLWFYGELIRHNTEEKLPLVIVQHGGAGTPEVCCSFYDSHNYNDMSMRILKKDVNIFAPQLLLWKDWVYNDGYGIRLELENELRRTGGSIAALEIYFIQRAIDYFESATWCDGKIGMIGMSYGSFYTLYTAACDPRIRVAFGCSLFSTRKMCFCNDFSWYNSYNKFGDAEVGALIYPRPLRIEFGDKDDSKWVSGAQEEFERLRSYYCGKKDELSIRSFDGGHEFSPDEEGIDWIIKKLIRS